MAVANCSTTLDGFLVPSKFSVILPKMIVDVANNIQQVEIPTLDIGTTEVRVPTIGAPLKLAGDSASYGDLTITFILDQDLVVYEMILAWIKACAYPEDTELFKAFTAFYKGEEKTAEAVLLQPLTVISNSGFSRDMVWDFSYAWPMSISGFTFDTTLTDATISTLSVTFAYSYFELNVAGRSQG